MANPLNDDHCRCADTILQSAAITADLINKCRDCGLDVEEAQRQNDDQREFARKIKANFFPDRA